jgi:hypothetical protein
LEGKLFKNTNSINSGSHSTPARRKSKKMTALSSALENTLFKNRTVGSSSGGKKKDTFVKTSSGKGKKLKGNNSWVKKQLQDESNSTAIDDGTIRKSPDDIASPDVVGVINKTKGGLKAKRKIVFVNPISGTKEVKVEEEHHNIERKDEVEDEDERGNVSDKQSSPSEKALKQKDGAERAETIIKKRDDVVVNGKNVVVVSKHYAYAFIFVFLMILGFFLKLYIIPGTISNVIVNEAKQNQLKEVKHDINKVYITTTANNKNTLNALTKEEMVKVEEEKNKKAAEDERKRKLAASAPPKHKIKKTCSAKGGYGAGCVYTADGAVSLNAGNEGSTQKKDSKPDPEAIARAEKARQVQSRKSKYKKWQEEKKKKSKSA